MTPGTLLLTGTKVGAGALLERWLRPIAVRATWAAACAALLAAGIAFSWPLLSVAAAALAVFWFVLRLFLHDTFGVDAPVAAAEDDRETLSHDVAFRISGFPAVTVASLIAAALDSPRGAFFLRELGLDTAEARAALLAEAGARPDDPAGFLAAARAALPRLRRQRVSPSVVLATAFAGGMGAELLHGANASLADVDAVVRAGVLAQTVAERNRPLSLGWMLRHVAGIGRSWAQGYTDALDLLTEDLSVTLDRDEGHVIRLHAEEQRQALDMLLTSTHHNVILIGEPGTGRRTLALHVAAALRETERKAGARETRIVRLRAEQLLSGVRSPDQFLLSALSAAKHAGTFLLVCDDLPLLCSAASQALRPVIARLLQEPTIRVLAVADPASYHALRASDPTIGGLLDALTVQEPPHAQVLDVLFEHSVALERRTRVTATYRAVEAVLAYSERFLGDLRLPGKALAMLDDAVALAVRAGERTVREEHIREVVSARTHVDVRTPGAADRDTLLSLEDRLNARIVGQGEAVRAVVAALKRACMDVGERRRPAGTFLLLGPTGVGKTHTALVLAEEYAGGGDRFVRVDLNEYATQASAESLFAGTDTSPLLRHIHDLPASVVLLDEIEKAHPSVLHQFLQLLDEGRVTDTAGRTHDFRHAVILATSNAGSAFIRSAVAAPDFDPSTFTKRLLEHVLDAGAFTPEFVNRFDAVIAFHPLTPDDAKRVLALMIGDIARKLEQQRGITLTVDEACLSALLERGVSAEFGARELRRLVADTVETLIAERLLAREWARGETLAIAASDLRF